jgi:hypothetical protein
MKNCFVTALLSAVVFQSCSKNTPEREPEPTTAHRTVIIYMAADNDLSYDAYADIREMKQGFTEKGTNLIVFFDPADDVPHILRITSGGSTKVMDYPEFDSADAMQMGKTLNDIIEMYPAEHYGLILWSHGTSWLPAGQLLRSFAQDGDRQMDIIDMGAALPLRFDFILLDACLMSAVEVAYELRGKTDFIVASPTETIYEGFPYDRIIPELLQGEPDLRKVAESYFDYYDSMQGAYRSASVSVINISEMDRLAAATAQAIAGQQFDPTSFDRSSVQRLDMYNEQYAFDFLDFIEKGVPCADIAALKEQLAMTVMYEAHTPRFLSEYDLSACCGLSCYIPNRQRDDMNTYYQRLDWCMASGFADLFTQ